MRLLRRLVTAMVTPPTRRQIDIEEATRLRVEEGLPATEIARRLGFTPAGVRRALKRAGVSLRPARNRTKALWGPQLVGLWRSLHQRCGSRRHPLFPRYGARGIAVCPEWTDFWAFYDWAIESGYRKGLNLHLAAGARCFSPATCRWITAQERMDRDGRPGGRRSEWRVTAFGETRSPSEWVSDPRCSVSADVLRGRLRRGVPPEDAIRLPPNASLPKDGRRVRASTGKRKLLNWREIVRLHVEEDLSHEEIAHRVDAAADTVYRGLKKRGVWRRTQEGLPHRYELRKVWENLVGRCEDESNPSFPHYGARGARVCRAWREFRVFHRWAIDAGYEPGLCLTRRDGTRVYAPRNCYWIPKSELADRAHHPDSRMPPRWTLEAFGERKGLTDWSRDPRCAVTLSGLRYRLLAGWRAEDALVTPSARGERTAGIKPVTAWRCTKSLAAWSRDGRCRVTVTALRERIAAGIPPEQAISTPPWGFRGRGRRRGHARRADRG